MAAWISLGSLDTTPAIQHSHMHTEFTQNQSVLLLPLLPGWTVRARGPCDVVCNPEEPLARPPPKSDLLSFVNFSSC